MEYVAIKDISLSVKKGEFLSILGPSGSGKTTLMNLIGALDRPSKGHIFIDGIDLASLNDDQLALVRNQKIGFIFQSYNLVPYLTVLENASLPLMIDNKFTPEKSAELISMLNEIGLGDKLNKKPNELSGGEQQRVAIVRALVNGPQIILADEPTGNLDSKTSDIVLRLLIKMAKEKGTTVVIVTHDTDVAKFSEREVHVRDGLIERIETHARKRL